MQEEQKRLFFGIEVHAPWPKTFPDGRIIDENSRHITVAFLGYIDFKPLKNILDSFPKPSFKIGACGICDKLLFLPRNHPRVVAWHVEWPLFQEKLLSYNQEIKEWLKSHQYPVDERENLSHVSIARAPFSMHEWKEDFSSIPLFTSAINLYESVGNLKYLSLWGLRFLPPFEEFEHTADIAFHIRGENFSELHLHAQMALSFKFPLLLPYLVTEYASNLDDIVIALNELVARADREVGCPFKAVSFHGDVTTDETAILNWEMIVDV